MIERDPKTIKVTYCPTQQSEHNPINQTVRIRKLKIPHSTLCSTGIGKSRLIHTLTHSREVIAYDHYPSHASSPFGEDEVDGLVIEEDGGLRERRASTMVQPAWDRPRFQEGDLGMDEVVPVKNLCFVDTVGYGVNLDVCFVFVFFFEG